MTQYPMAELGSRTAEGRAKVVAVLRNMADAVEAETDGNGELGVYGVVNCGLAWIGEPDTWTVYEGWIHFSAGPNSVATWKWPEAWKEKQCGHEEYRTDMRGETAIAVCGEPKPCPLHK